MSNGSLYHFLLTLLDVEPGTKTGTSSIVLCMTLSSFGSQSVFNPGKYEVVRVTGMAGYTCNAYKSLEKAEISSSSMHFPYTKKCLIR